MAAKPSDDRARMQATVAGFVQGVSFRYYTQRRAAELGLTGWVRNLRDGSVEVVAEGNRAALAALEEFLRLGPPAAQVTGVDLAWQEPTGEFAGFDVRYA